LLHLEISIVTGPAVSDARRYIQLALIIMAGGAIYPLVYIRQNFEVTILESFGITLTQLGQCYSLLGVMFVATYIPGGWLADRISPRWLISSSLVLTGVIGIWFSTMPNISGLRLIFVGWGISTGLTFWAAMIKGVAIIAKSQEQGRFFGLLDGGRGLVEAVLASVALVWFSYSLTHVSDATDMALRKVIYLYVGFALLISPLIVWIVDDVSLEEDTLEVVRTFSTWQSLKIIAASREIWLGTICIWSGYQLFWATYSFSGYLQSEFGMTAVAVGTITVTKLWMRPIGAIGAGFIGDYLNLERSLGWLLLASTISLIGIIIVPADVSATLLLFIVLTIGLLTYAVRGIFWGTLDRADIPNQTKGLAIGVVSLISYSPDIYLPLINGPILEIWPGRVGYSIYFGLIVLTGFIGAAAAFRLRSLVAERDVN